MLKDVKKRILPLFFALVTLTMFSPAMPMKWLYSLFKKQKQQKITVNNLPLDCLHEIIKFLGHKKPLDLKLVSKDFKTVLENYPCFLANINGNNKFLCYDLTERENFFTVKIYNEEGLNRFVKESFLSNVSGKDFFISMRLHKKFYVESLAAQLENLRCTLSAKNNAFSSLKICFHDTPPSEEYITELKLNDKNKTWVTIFGKNNINNKELKTFKDVQKLDITKCKSFGNSNVELPKNLWDLDISHCPNLILKNLENLLTVQKKLSLSHRFKNEKTLKNLEKKGCKVLFYNQNFCWEE